MTRVEPLTVALVKEGAAVSTSTPAVDGRWPASERLALLPAASRMTPPFKEMPLTATPSPSLSPFCTV